MKTVDTSAKIKCVIEMALKGEISWLMLDSIITGLTPTLEKSKQIIKALLKEFENHQTMCLMKESDIDNEISEGVIEIDENQSLTNSVTTIQQRNYEEERFQTFDERESPMKSEDMISEDDKLDTFSANEQHKSMSDFSGADSENEYLFHENDVSKNIKLVEANKGQYYTFVEDDSEEKPLADGYNISLDSDFDHSRNEEACSKINGDMSSRKSFECETCGKFFNNKFLINRHIRIHTGEKPYKCKYCKKNFANSRNLKLHERTHTGEKPYRCKYCKNTFAQSSNLKKHERSHTGERPYGCKTCSEQFSCASSLSVHERTHTGERPFQCKTCEKNFSESSTAKRHERTHTGERPFKCKTCDKSFIQSHHLKKHEKVHLRT